MFSCRLYGMLVSLNHVGDLSQAKYAQIYLKNKYKGLLEVKIFDVETDDFESMKNFDYFHCFGEKALIFIDKIKKNNELKGKIIIQIHQHFPLLELLQPEYLIIPKSTFIDHKSLQKTHKFLLNGILFEKHSEEELKKYFYQSQISQKVTLSQQYIIIMLSGDAPDQKQMKYFDKESVDILFYRLIFLLGKLSFNGIYPRIIVQNGPRTGKHNPNTGQQVCNHVYQKNKDSPESAIDQISLYFINKLQKMKIKYDFFNFSFEISESGRKVISFYKPLLYVGMQKQNYFLFPMQSVSMCSELPFYIQSSRLIAYHTSSTNQEHIKVVNEGFLEGRFQKIGGSNDGIGKLECIPKNIPTKYNEIQQILDQIIKNN